MFLGLDKFLSILEQISSLDRFTWAKMSLSGAKNVFN